MRKTKFALAISLMFGALPSLQAADKPPAAYWMSISTEVGGAFGMGGMPSAGEMVSEGLLGGMFGGSKSGAGESGGARRAILLQLSGAETPSDPKADHFIPPGQNMGESLPLISPRTDKLSRHEAPDEAQEPEKPKGKILMYWGCGDKIRAGQPKILDMASASPQQYVSFFKAYNVSAPRGPRPANGWTYARWPNEKDNQPVPKDSSLVGPQTIKANYAPEIRFDIPRAQDFLDPVVFTEMGSNLEEAVSFRWKSIPNATGYFTMAMGGRNDNEMIIWVSSEAPHMGWSLMDYVPTGEVRRLVKERVIMPPSNTECKIPQGVFKDAGAMLQFIAYGQDLDLSHPARPKNPPKGWMPDWNAKVRLKSTTMTILGQDERGKSASEAEDERDSASPQHKKGGTDILEKPLKSIKGIFGL
ncbi:MAG: hypothetical protein KKH74_02895 [Gammaproteobacteria bacterium]|nr:hypothetical protein [Gammaproteobacteria bacterium]MBU1732939.1 hypothetical protein [Gammaproteobacteria bacterium]MBU1891987.1 hypothetical protein [Gammaproteobacteria bacterium]